VGGALGSTENETRVRAGSIRRLVRHRFAFRVRDGREAAVIIIAMLSGALRWLADLTEVVAVAAAILLSGLIIGMSVFWGLSRLVAKLSGQTPEFDPYEQERDETLHADVISIRTDEDSSHSQPGE